MSEDFLNQARQQNENMSVKFYPEIYNRHLSDLFCRFQDCGMPKPDVRMELHYEIYQETNNDAYILG